MWDGPPRVENLPLGLTGLGSKLALVFPGWPKASHSPLCPSTPHITWREDSQVEGGAAVDLP